MLAHPKACKVINFVPDVLILLFLRYLVNDVKDNWLIFVHKVQIREIIFCNLHT